jgi:hypothetical protein
MMNDDNFDGIISSDNRLPAKLMTMTTNGCNISGTTHSDSAHPNNISSFQVSGSSISFASHSRNDDSSLINITTNYCDQSLNSSEAVNATRKRRNLKATNKKK